MRVVIEPGLASANYWRDLWRYRELLYFLAWRDLVVRYKQTVIGVVWALLRPGLTLAAFVAFRRLVGAGRSDAPEPVLVMAALLPWQFFSSALLEASNSLIGNANLLSKVYFPRLIIPLAAVTTALADFAITLVLLGVLMLVYAIAPSPAVLLMPVFILEAFALAVGGGLWLAALNVRYRDFRYIVPFVIQMSLFVSPIAFTIADVPERFRAIFALNPLVGIIEGFRWAILGVTPNVPAVVSSMVITVVVLAIGIYYFRGTERSFADVV
ncbi:MAG TPA: ABC transporter permease [Vicinamibacterales bacterium]|nr:ABC transporter permease [Vicinamibacterales bacterium]